MRNKIQINAKILSFKCKITTWENNHQIKTKVWFFCFFTEAMSLFLVVENVCLKGIAMPLDEKNGVDVEFADDTGLYLDGYLINL